MAVDAYAISSHSYVKFAVQFRSDVVHENVVRQFTVYCSRRSSTPAKLTVHSSLLSTKFTV